jgi:hypothetical protein
MDGRVGNQEPRRDRHRRGLVCRSLGLDLTALGSQH